jgi:REP element-mobilizing transposase RayT
VTFCTRNRETLAPRARDIVLRSCIYDHEKRCWVDCVVVMPDHVHLIVTPYDDVLLWDLLDDIKGASVHQVNRVLGRRGKLWQRESFDRMLRSDENLYKKCEYIFNNPVRAGLVERWEDYPWLWSPDLVERRPPSGAEEA